MGKSRVGRFTAVVIRLQSALRPPRLGITVTRRYGKSHLRNRFKRLVREVFRIHSQELPQGLDIIVKPRAHALRVTFPELARELLELIACETPHTP